MPYDNHFYDTKEQAEQALIKPEELSKMLEETLKHISEDNEVRELMEYFKELTDKGLYILLDGN